MAIHPIKTKTLRAQKWLYDFAPEEMEIYWNEFR